MQREDVSILIVDDVNTIRVQIRELLKSFGFKKIATAQNGIEAQVLLESEPVHIILADWHMSPVDGHELLLWVRAHRKLARTAFIMVTAENTQAMVVKALKNGVDDFVIKPLTPMQIQNKVYGVLLKKLT